MKLREFIILVNQLTNRIDKALKDVDLCKECDNGTSPEEHMKRHIDEAADIKEKLPHEIVCNLKNIQMPPDITFKLDRKGHIKINLDEIEIF